MSISSSKHIFNWSSEDIYHGQPPILTIKGRFFLLPGLNLLILITMGPTQREFVDNAFPTYQARFRASALPKSSKVNFAVVPNTAALTELCGA